MPKVSVCIPTYNYAHYLGPCIESVLAQTFDDWELIVVDDCSSDNTEEVVRAIRDSRIRFFSNEHNLGLVRNVNHCISLANGDYVCVLHADDLLLPKMLERSVAVLDAHPGVGFTHTAYYRIDENGTILDVEQRWESDRVMGGAAALRNLLMDHYLAIATVLTRRDCYRILGSYDESYEWAYGWEMELRIALHYDVAYIAEPLACHRDHSGSLTQRKYFVNPRAATAEERRLLEQVFSKLPATPEWHHLRSVALQRVVNRHAGRAYWLLRQGEAARFRSELAYAVGLDRKLLLRYPGLMALWLASLLGARGPNWLISAKQALCQISCKVKGK